MVEEKEKNAILTKQNEFPQNESGYSYISTLSTLIPHAVVASSNTT